MAITSIKTGSSFTNLTKYNDFLAGNPYYQPTAYDSIATVTVGSGGAANIEFTSIPSGYQHLQIRGTGLITSAAGFTVQFNSDTGSNYSWHQLYGEGSIAQANAGASQTFMYTAYGAGSTTAPNAFVMDILDYKNTSKFKTLRSLSGNDLNGSGYIQLWSGNWRSTSAVTSIKITSSFNQYTKFGLFGIKGA
jgi:hypothetical protein